MLSANVLEFERVKVGRMLSKDLCSLTLPGSKSYTNRALVMAALSSGETLITGISPSDDSNVLLTALRRIGVACSEQPNNSILVSGLPTALPTSHVIKIDVGAAGTSMRFLVGLLASLPGVVTEISGSERMHQRPIADLVNALRQLGAKIEYTGTAGCPPLRIEGQHLTCQQPISISGKTSSQFISALLMIAPRVHGGLQLKIEGELVSKSYLNMTIASMREFGVAVKNEQYQTLTVGADSAYSCSKYHVEGDASGASYFWALAALSGRPVRVCNLKANSAQGDVNFPMLLARMGCAVTFSSKNAGPAPEDNWIQVTRGKRLIAINADMELMPDTAQTLAMVAAFSEGDSKITGLQTLRVKETDRLLALVTEFSKLGIKAEAGDDWLNIEGNYSERSLDLDNVIDTYEDHRMAMSYAILSATHGPLIINKPAVVSKSYPNFWVELAKIGVPLECA